MQGVQLASHARFMEVVQPHLGNAHSLACALAKNRTDAEDIVQEACLRALRGIAHFRGDSPRAWVLTIVRNTAYDWMRRGQRVPELVEDLEGLVETLMGPDDAVTPESTLAADQDAQQMEQAIELLPAQFRLALRLYYENGLSYLEIADAIGVPPGTVMSRLCRARRQLAELVLV